MLPHKERQSGAALMSALIIMVICAMLATMMIMSQRFLIHQASLVTQSDNMTLDLQGGQEWAKSVLLQNKDLRNVKPLSIKLHGVHLEATIVGAQGLFNLNSLLMKANQAQFVRLMQAAVPDVSSAQAGAVARSLIQWVGRPGASLSSADADNYYLKLSPPYRVPHRLMVDPSELRLVRGMTAKLYYALQPFITVLPGAVTQVDINYASPQVLMSLNSSLTLAQTQGMAACRSSHGFFTNTGDFMQLCAPGIKLTNITVNSQYYLLKSTASFGDQVETQTSLLMRLNGRDNKPGIRVVWQEINGG
jgi:general secretion pathway protein K